MRYKTVGDLIEFARYLHSLLADQYAELEQLTTSERAAMLLDYLNRHEARLANMLKEYELDAVSGILNTWMQYTPEFMPDALIQRLRSVDLSDVDAIVDVAIYVDQYLVSLYSAFIEKVDVEDVRAVFENLLAMELSEQHRIARNAYRLNDL